MVSVRLKGIARVSARLADGRRVVYWYAWRGGPRLDGEPGSPEFVASYNRAIASRAARVEGTVLQLVGKFRTSAEFKKIAEKTAKDYRRYLSMIESEFGDMPLDLLGDRRARAVFLEWRDTFADRPRAADYAWTVLNRVFSWAKGRGEISVNPCERGGRLYAVDRAESVWTADDFAALFAVCSDEVRYVVRLAVLTAQRQADLLSLAWSRIEDGEIRLRQAKRGRRVTLPLYSELEQLLAEIPRRSTTILTNSHGEPWTSDGFRSSFGKACDRAGIAGKTFHDLRGTAITYFAMRGMTALEIASLAGWAERDVSALLDKHYLGGRADLARAAVARCLGNESGLDSAKRTQNAGNGPAEPKLVAFPKALKG